jgi:hypothetical protein
MAHSLIDPDLVEQRILALAQYGAYGETGVWRTVYSPEWVAATDLYAQWCREAGLTVARDPGGDVWGRLQGSEGGAAIVSGSHIDTQRPGGRYDGALGAIAAVTAIEALAARFGQPRQHAPREIRADRAQAAPSSSESRRLRVRRSRSLRATPLCRSCPAYRRGAG